MYHWKQKISSFIVIFTVLGFVTGSNVLATDKISAKAYVLMEAGSGRILSARNESEKLPMASTTKIMTTLIALEQPQLDEPFIVDENALKVAEYLASRTDKVAWVNYPGMKGSKYYELAQKYMPNGTCGVLTFGLKGGRDESIRFMDSLQLGAIVTHVADARTSVLHPASHTHRQLTDEQLIAAGVAPDLIRFSVGIEDADDIIADIEQALAKSGK